MDEKKKGKTAQGVTFEKQNPTEDYIAGQVPTTAERGDGFYPFKIEQLEFLQEYARDLDVKRAAKEVGITPKSAENMMANPAIRKEIESIHDAWRTNIKMTAEFASSHHIKLLQKLEKDYDDSDLGTKAKFAGSLVKGSESYLRAAGHFSPKGGEAASQVTINIDLGGEDKPITIDGETVDK